MKNLSSNTYLCNFIWISYDPKKLRYSDLNLPHFTLKPWDVIGPLTTGLVGGPGRSGLVVQTNTSLGELFPSTLEANSWNKITTSLSLFTATAFLAALHQTSFSNCTKVTKLESMPHPEVCGILITDIRLSWCFFTNHSDFFPLPPSAIDHDMFKIKAVLVFPLKKKSLFKITVSTGSIFLIKGKKNYDFAIFVLELFQTAIYNEVIQRISNHTIRSQIQVVPLASETRLQICSDINTVL